MNLHFQKLTPPLTKWSCPNRTHVSKCALRWCAAFLLSLSMLLTVGQNLSYAQTTINREYRIKAAYLFNFGRYTQWPEDYWKTEETPFVIGILGVNPFGTSLDQIATQKELQGRKILVHYFKDITEYQPCQILYISVSVPIEKQRAIIAKLAHSKVLLIGEQYNFLQEGGMVSFLLEENKVRFGVNLDPINRDNLKISSKVLKLAAIVKKENQEK